MDLIEKPRENYYMLSFLDEFMIGHKGFICGGCFKNIFNHEKLKDIDVFFECREDFEGAVRYFDGNDDDFYLYYENANVRAYKHKASNTTVELCCKIFGTAEQILNQFDFTVSKFAYFKKLVEDDDGDGSHIEYAVLMHAEFFEHLHMKRLVIDDEIPYPMSTLERMFRYVKYGYMPCRETKLKIANAINDLSKEQISVSESLYNGMD